jgi:hypothetical protein
MVFFRKFLPGNGKIRNNAASREYRALHQGPRLPVGMLGQGGEDMGGWKEGSLQEMAVRLLRGRVRQNRLATPAETEEELAGLLRGRRKDDGTLTVAQAILLTVGQKALNGDKAMTEYLQKLADQQAARKEPDKAAEEGKTIIRVRLVDGNGGVTAEREEKS